MEQVYMPQLGISEDSALLTQWHVRPGDRVAVGDRLFSIETGKSSFEVESEYEGSVLALYAAEGEEVAVKGVVCVIGKEGEAPPGQMEGAPPAAENTAPSPAKGAALPSAQSAASSSAPPPARGGGEPPVRGISPRARHLAEKNGVDPSLATPTGPDGRVIERDVRALLAKPESSQASPAEPALPYEDKPLSVIRKTIARNMTRSLQNTAQLTHTASFDASDILMCRKRFKSEPAMSGVTLTDMILYAVSRVLPEHPSLNAWLLEDSLRLFSEVHLAVAVDTERGLMVPVIFGASGMSLSGLSAQAKALAEECRKGSINPALLEGGSFTVSNLGGYGIESFTPILNAPQTGILGVNTITQRLRVVEGCIGAYPAMSLSLTYDHRAVDGAPASRFLQALCKKLENFSEMTV